MTVEEGARLVVVGELDLADIEEVEGFPLRRRRARGLEFLGCAGGLVQVRTYRESHGVPIFARVTTIWAPVA